MESTPMFSLVVSGLMGTVGVGGVAAGTVVLTVHCLAVLVRGKTFILVRVEGSYSSTRISLGSAPSAGLIQLRASLRFRPRESRASRLQDLWVMSVPS